MSVSTPTVPPPSQSDSPAAPQSPRWPLWFALALQWGVVVLVVAGLLGAKAAAGTLDNEVVRSVVIAALIVSLAGTVALVIASLAGNPKQAANFVLAGMLVRLFVPLAAMLVVPKNWPELAEAGFRDQILVLYLAALVVETYAAIRVTGMPRPRFTAK